MSTHEIGLWSALAGGLLTLAALSLTDLFPLGRNLGAVRNAVFVLLGGTAVIVVSGLPEALFPGLTSHGLTTTKIAIGPLAAGLILYYLGLWFGGPREDVVVHHIATWGSRFILLASAGLIVSAQIAPSEYISNLLAVAGAITLLAALLGIGMSIRATHRNDPLARWMALACILLFLMAAGVYIRGLQVSFVGLKTWALTVALGIAYFVLTVALVGKRNRDNLKLSRLARMDPIIEPTTGLPSGSSLVSKVEHAFWQAARRQGRCTVVCIHLRNLYELADSVGHGVDYQILLIMAARIRRVVGFRCLVGIYHPRCFVVVLDTDRHRERMSTMLLRLKASLPQPMQVLGTDAQTHAFTPTIGLGLVEASAESANPLDVLHYAEREAQYSNPTSSEDFVKTTA